MDILFIVLGSICLLVGIAGCILPGIPGVPIAYLAILFAHWTDRAQLSWQELVIWTVIMIVIQVLDYIIPAWGTKKFGGSKWGVWGSVLGLVIGMFFGLPGIILGPFVGAVLGEIVYLNRNKQCDTSPASQDEKFKRAVHAGLGSFIGLLVGTIFKLIFCGAITFQFIKHLV